MKRIFIAAAMALMYFTAAGQDVVAGSVSYALPKTDLIFEVTAQQEVFHAGPYARFAQKYLGTTARQKDETNFKITGIKLTSAAEADQTSRYAVILPEDHINTYLQLTTQGLIAKTGASLSEGAEWRFPLSAKGSFEGKGVPSNLVSESSTLQGEQGIITQSATVEKSLERKAQEVADMIFKIRDNRYKILVGDTDATYSGEAMKATMEELDKLEKDYTTLFLGYSEFNTHSAVFEVVPSAENARQMYVAFRVSDTEGLVSADNMSGKPIYLQLNIESVAMPERQNSRQKPKAEIFYRIPAICKATLTDGVNCILQLRVPVYQLGTLSSYPIFSK